MPIIPDHDPNEAYDITMSDRPPDWWTVTCNGIPDHRFPPGDAVIHDKPSSRT